MIGSCQALLGRHCGSRVSGLTPTLSGHKMRVGVLFADCFAGYLIRVTRLVFLGWLIASAGVALAGEGRGAHGPNAAGVGAALERVLAVPPGAEAPEPSGDVAIDFSPTARPNDVLREALLAEQERNWRRAAELYQRLLDEVPDQLCNPSPRLYVPIRDHVEERLAGLPPEGLAAYRQLVDRQATGDFGVRISDFGFQAAIASRFLLSSRGDNALDRVATGWLARGEAGRALRAWRRMLALCKDSDVPPGPLAAKLAVCLVELGEPATARAFLAEAERVLGPDAGIEVAGRSACISDFRSQISDFRSGRQSAICNLQSAIRPGALVWSDAIAPRPEVPAVGDGRARLMVDGEDAAAEPSVRVLPVVAGDAAIYPTRNGLSARDLATGKLRWEWPWLPEAGRWRGAGPFSLPTGAFGGHWACSEGDGRVFCSLPMQMAALRGGMGMVGELVALDLMSGALAWRRMATELLPADRAAGGWFVSAPLPVGGRLLVGVRSGGGGDDYYLCCLRAGDGELVWRTFVAARPSDPLFRLGYQAWFEGMPCESRGLAVVCTGGGIVAAVEVATGGLRWLARYDQAGSRRAGWRRWYRHDGWRSWTPLSSGGVVYATPPDSDFIYAMDVDSGRLLWRREREDHRHLAGARDGRAYIVGADATCLGPSGEAVWRVQLPSAAVGRAALAGRVLHVPVAGGIIFLDAATGSELAWTSWDDWQAARAAAAEQAMTSGDLLIAGGRLFVVGPYTLSVFAPLDRKGAIERQLAADPADPLAHYARGQECQWEGDAAGAATAFEKVLAARQGSVADALSADALRRLAACYADLSLRHEQQGRHDQALADCDSALRHTPAGQERQTLLLRAAALATKLRRWERAVAAYQEVLGATEPSDANWQAARSALDALLREAGRQCYEPFERLAAATLERGAQADLEAVAKRYPTSVAAPAALVRLAEAAERDGRLAEARLWLLQLVRDYPDAKAAPAALHRLAAGYAREGARAMARGALARLGRMRNEEVEAFLAGHGPAQPRPALSGAEGAAMPHRPPFAAQWDVRPGYGAAELRAVAPENEPPDVFFLVAGRSLECRGAADGLLRWADRPGWIGVRIVDAERRGGGVRIVSTVAGGEVFPGHERPVPGLDATPAERAGLRGGDVLVGFDGKRLRDAQDLIGACTERRAGSVVKLDFLRGEEPRAVEVRLGVRPSLVDDAHVPPVAFAGATGGLAFLRKATRLDAIEVGSGEVAWSVPAEPLADGSEEVGAAVAPGVVAAAESRGRLTALDAATGRRLWASRIQEPVIHGLALWEHGLVVASSRPPTVRLLNPFDGSVAFEAGERHALGAPAAAVDTRGRLCYAVGPTVGCYDAVRRQLLWSVRVANFAARRLWVAGPAVIAHGVDGQGLEVLECRHAASGGPAWSLALARGERLLFAEAGADGFYVGTRQAAQGAIRRLDISTGQVAWAHALRRGEELTAWDASGPAIIAGLAEQDERGRRRGALVAFEKLTGAIEQRLGLGGGAIVGFSRLGPALLAVVEDDARGMQPDPWLGDVVVTQPPKFRIVRLNGVPR